MSGMARGLIYSDSDTANKMASRRRIMSPDGRPETQRGVRLFLLYKNQSFLDTLKYF